MLSIRHNPSGVVFLVSFEELMKTMKTFNLGGQLTPDLKPKTPYLLPSHASRGCREEGKEADDFESMILDAFSEQGETSCAESCEGSTQKAISFLRTFWV